VRVRRIGSGKREPTIERVVGKKVGFYWFSFGFLRFSVQSIDFPKVLIGFQSKI